MFSRLVFGLASRVCIKGRDNDLYQHAYQTQQSNTRYENWYRTNTSWLTTVVFRCESITDKSTQFVFEGNYGWARLLSATCNVQQWLTFTIGNIYNLSWSFDGDKTQWRLRCYKVVQIWLGLICVCPGHIWIALYKPDALLTNWVYFSNGHLVMLDNTALNETGCHKYM
jgi:hypothetical protein